MTRTKPTTAQWEAQEIRFPNPAYCERWMLRLGPVRVRILERADGDGVIYQAWVHGDGGMHARCRWTADLDAAKRAGIKSARKWLREALSTISEMP